MDKIYDREQLWIVAYDKWRGDHPETTNADICDATGIKSSYMSNTLGRNRSRPISEDARDKISVFMGSTREEVEREGLRLSTPQQADLGLPPVWTVEQLANKKPAELTRDGVSYGNDLTSSVINYAHMIGECINNLIVERNRLYKIYTAKRAILESISDAVKVQTADRIVVYANRQYRAMAETDPLNRVCANFCDDACLVLDCFKSGQAESGIKMFNGRWYGIRCAPIFGDDGEVEKVVTSIRDITEEHEKALRGEVSA